MVELLTPAEGPALFRANPLEGATTMIDVPRTLPEEITKDLVKLFKLLADETRLKILHYLLNEQELHVRALCELLGQSQPAVSHHLGLLRTAGLIESRREGKHNYYHLLMQRFHDLLDMIFAAAPKSDRRIRFEDYVLSYAPPGEERRR